MLPVEPLFSFAKYRGTSFNKLNLKVPNVREFLVYLSSYLQNAIMYISVTFMNCNGLSKFSHNYLTIPTKQITKFRKI